MEGLLHIMPLHFSNIQLRAESNVLKDILTAQSSVQNSVCFTITAVAIIVVKGCSRVLLGLLSTSKPDRYVTMAAGHRVLTNSARLRRPDSGDGPYVGHP